MSTRPPTPVSPNAKIKPPTPGTPMFGCEHVQRLFSFNAEATNTSISHYRMILRALVEKALVAQTTKGVNGHGVTCLTSTYLCLQCSTIVTEEERAAHGNQKSHRFYVDSRSGCLYCQMCDDYVWDATLEELRIRKMCSGTFATRKRKMSDVERTRTEAQFVSANTQPIPCRANGLRGLYNAGATCYQNVVLQAFLHNPILRNFYLSDGHPSSECTAERHHCLSCAMEELFQEFYALDSTAGYAAANILSAFWISEKKAFENLVTTKEQDAHEFFQFLAEALHDRNGGVSTAAMGSEHNCECIIHKTFYGKLLSTTTCQHCGSVTDQVQSFLDLSLPLENLAQRKGKKGSSASSHGTSATAKGTGNPPPLLLEECLEEEYIKGDKCEYRCHQCNSTQQARRHTSIKMLPNVLSIQLKRFEFRQNGRKDATASKIDTPLQFPLELRMHPYTTHARTLDNPREAPELNRMYTYELFSVVVHVGDIDTGHYVSYCRVGDQWFAFNDHRVDLASKSEVLGARAYLLFYVLRSLP